VCAAVRAMLPLISLLIFLLDGGCLAFRNSGRTRRYPGLGVAAVAPRDSRRRPRPSAPSPRAGPWRLTRPAGRTGCWTPSRSRGPGRPARPAGSALQRPWTPGTSPVPQ